MNNPGKPILLFDGVCNLCNGFVQFLLKRDKRGALLFAPLQSASGQAYLERFGLPRAGFLSVVLVEGDRHSQRSTAGLRSLRALGWPWKAFYALILLPRPLRDLGYDLIARNRYRLFGKRDACMIPTPEIRARFLP
jgi:predicted DCC family thiol-disulfide oxidoreductase YuxK